jgi:Protein of unknown function (DUF433)
MSQTLLEIKDEYKRFLPAAFRMDASERTFSWHLLRENVPAPANGAVVVHVDAFSSQAIPTSFIRRMMSELTEELHLTTSLTARGYVEVKNLSTQSTSDEDPKVPGTNIPIYRLAALRDGGMTEDQIAEDFPSLTREQIDGALAYAKLFPNQGKQYPRKSLKRALRKSGFHGIAKELADLKKAKRDRGDRGVSPR